MIIMKKVFALVLIIFTGFHVAVAQDIITLKSGQELKARILRLNPKDVIFIAENNPDTVYLLRDEITKLQYRSGIIVYLSDNEYHAPAMSASSTASFDVPVNDSLYWLGEKDASRYYKGYQAASTGTLICSLFFPWGLVPAIACSSSPPSMNSLGYRDQKLMENSSYFNGYTKQAYKIKKKKVWQGFAIGSGAVIGFSILMSVLVATTY